MGNAFSASDHARRAEIISLVRIGSLTPEQAEAEAIAKGWPPFATKPPFDPMKQTRWDMVMAVTWIAWRDLRLVGENAGDFRAGCTDWFFRKWRGPSDDGSSFIQHEGWWLETLMPLSTIGLSLLELRLRITQQIPATAQSSIDGARGELWRMLEDGTLVAEALDTHRRPVEIPQKDWSYLKLYEERECDVLKFDVLDRQPAYTEIKFKRADLFSIWAPASSYKAADLDPGFITAEMIEPMMKAGTDGYVPLCCAFHWLMTTAGTRQVAVNDAVAWTAARNKLLPWLQSDQVEITGVPAAGGLAQRISGTQLAAVRIPIPGIFEPRQFGLDAPTHIACTPFLGLDSWENKFSDRLYVTGKAAPLWTHLQVRKSQLLKHFPRPTAKVAPESGCFAWLLEEIAKSPSRRPKSKDEYRKIARNRFKGLGMRQFDRTWSNAIRESRAFAWSKAGPPKRSDQRTS